MIYALVSAAVIACSVWGGAYARVAPFGCHSSVDVPKAWTIVLDHQPEINDGFLYDKATGQQLFDSVTGLPIYA